MLSSVPGIGEIVAITLVSSLIGVAPLNKDSGKFRGKRRIRGRRAKIRYVLYMATFMAVHFNPGIKAFDERLQ